MESVFPTGTGVHMQDAPFFVHHHLKDVAMAADVKSWLRLVKQLPDSGGIPTGISANVGDQHG